MVKIIQTLHKMLWWKRKIKKISQREKGRGNLFLKVKAIIPNPGTMRREKFTFGIQIQEMVRNLNWYILCRKTLNLAIYNTSTKITTSFNWNGGSSRIMRIKIHNYDRDVVMEMSPYTTVNLFQVWVSHFSFLCSFTKRRFYKFLCYSLYKNTQHEKSYPLLNCCLWLYATQL